MGVNGFILAAGLGTRLKPLTDTTPKPLLKVAGKECISYSLDLLNKINAEEVVINTHHLSNKIEEYFNKNKFNFPVKISYEKNILGTAGGFLKGCHLFKNKQTTIVLSGDVVSNVDLNKAFEFHKEKKSQFTIGVIKRDDVSGSGIVGFNNDYSINKFLEKPTEDKQIFSHWINGSIYIIEPSINNYIPINHLYDFGKQLLPDIISKEIPVYAYCLPKRGNYISGIDTNELIMSVEKDIMSGKIF